MKVGSAHLVAVLLILIKGDEAVTLSSTLPYEGNSITACPNSNVTLICMVTQRPTLRWEAVPGLSEQFFISQDIDRDRVTLIEGPFTLTLVNVSQPSGGLADLTSTLEVMVDDIDDGTNITCKGTTDEDYVVIHKRASPSAPSNVMIMNEFHVENFSIILSWDHPLDDVLVDSYRILTNTTTHPLSTTNYTVVLEGKYNIPQQITLSAINCAGSSEEVTKDVLFAGCSPPIPPVNGSVNGFTSSRVGAQVTYHCDTDLVLMGERVATCSQSLQWLPSSQSVTCVQMPAVPTVSPMNTTNTPVAIIAAPVTVVVVALTVVIVLVLLLLRYQSERWTMLCHAIARRKPPVIENSYGGMELLRPGSSNSGGLASPRSDTSYDVITTGTEARHNGTSPAQPQLYSGDNTMKSLQTYAEVTVEQSNELPHLSLAEQPVKYSEIVVQPVHPPRPHIPPKPSSKLSPHTPNAMFGSLSQHTNDRKDKHPLDKLISIDLVIQQLQELTPHWRAVGQAADIQPTVLNDIATHFMGNDKDSFAEVMNQYFIPNTTTWADLANVCVKAGFTDLADALQNSYRTGVLPVQIEDDTVIPPPSDPAPPIPPREADNEDLPPTLPPSLAAEDVSHRHPSRHRKPPALPPSIQSPSDTPPLPPKPSPKPPPRPPR